MPTESPEKGPDKADLQTFIKRVKESLERITERLDTLAVEHVGKPVEAFTDEDYEALRHLPEVGDLLAQHEREEAQLRALEGEAAREQRDIESLLAQAELDEDIEGGD